MDAVVAGIKAKLSKAFDIDPLQMAEDTFGEPFKQWSGQLTEFKTTRRITWRSSSASTRKSSPRSRT
jgi:hypothetical protein